MRYYIASYKNYFVIAFIKTLQIECKKIINECHINKFESINQLKYIYIYNIIEYYET
jgi:hypothetical protein